LDAWCRDSLAGYKCPKEYHFVDEVPRNPMGKLDKRALRQAFA
jgi:acyl-CoA synthetase (AMP-forming)/AMP-acid ligase II